MEKLVIFMIYYFTFKIELRISVFYENKFLFILLIYLFSLLYSPEGGHREDGGVEILLWIS